MLFAFIPPPGKDEWGMLHDTIILQMQIDSTYKNNELPQLNPLYLIGYPTFYMLNTLTPLSMNAKLMSKSPFDYDYYAQFWRDALTLAHAYCPSVKKSCILFILHYLNDASVNWVGVIDMSTSKIPKPLYKIYKYTLPYTSINMKEQALVTLIEASIEITDDPLLGGTITQVVNPKNWEYEEVYE